MPSPPSSSYADAEADAFTKQVKESSHLLHGSAPNTDARRMRSGARQTPVLRIGTRAGPSRRSHRSGTSGTSPGGGPRIPFPHTRMNPTSIDVTSTGGIRTRALFSDLRRFHVKPAHSPRKCTPYLPLQSGCTRRDARIRCASPMHGTRTAPAKADISSTLFHLSTTPSIPSNATYSTADLQYPHSSGVRLVLTCYGT